MYPERICEDFEATIGNPLTSVEQSTSSDKDESDYHGRFRGRSHTNVTDTHPWCIQDGQIFFHDLGNFHTINPLELYVIDRLAHLEHLVNGHLGLKWGIHWIESFHRQCRAFRWSHQQLWWLGSQSVRKSEQPVIACWHARAHHCG